MSVYFCTVDEQDLWNPATIVARLFRDQVESVARVLGIESGLGEIVSDEVVVDKVKFEAFMAAFSGLMLRTAPESGVHSLMGGCFEIVLALGDKLGGTGSETTVISPH